MPVADTPVHYLTVGSARYDACREKVRKAGYYAPDREYQKDGSFVIVPRWIDDTSSTECRYDKSMTDQKCQCPRAGSGEAYAERVMRDAGLVTHNAKVSGAGTASAGLPG